MQKQLSAERVEKEREIGIRDEKLMKRKKQMAEALKGNSWYSRSLRFLLLLLVLNICRHIMVDVLLFR